jgi:hypothetical protein
MDDEEIVLSSKSDISKKNNLIINFRKIFVK